MSNPYILRSNKKLSEDEIIEWKKLIGESPLMIIPDSDMEVVYLNTISNLCNEAYEIAKSKGWHDEPREMGTVLALIHSEVSEALEADRKGDYDNFIEELADVCIRIFDLCGSASLDLEKTILDKMEVNRGREYKHGKRY